MDEQNTVTLSAPGIAPVTIPANEFLSGKTASFAEDLSQYEFQVKVTYIKPDVTEVFDTLEKAKAFASDQLKDSRVVKVHIKKVEPDDVKEGVDGGSDSDDGL